MNSKPIVEYSGLARVCRWDYCFNSIVARIPAVDNHPKLGTCRAVRTSLVMQLHPNGVIETMNTLYVPADPQVDGYVLLGVTEEDIRNQRILEGL